MSTPPPKPIPKPMLGGTNPTYAAPPNSPIGMLKGLGVSSAPSVGTNPTNSPIKNKLNQAADMLKGLPLAPSGGADPLNNPITNKLNNLTAMVKAPTPPGFNPLPGFNPDAKKIRQQKIATGEYKPATTYSGMRTDGGPGVPGSMYMKKGGKVKSSSAKSKVSTASSRGDGIAQRGKTKGRMV